MRNYVYLFFNLLVLLPPLLISIFSDVKTYKNWRALGVAILSVSVPFILWDVWAAANNHWFFSTTYISVPRFWGLPFEEILFFVTVPFAMAFVWDVLAKQIPNKPVSEVLAGLGLSLISLASFVLLFSHWSRGYTRSAAIATLIAVLVVVLSGWWRRNRFWWFQAVLFTAFFVTNTFLTALPVITYGDGSYIGFRVGTIPLEDFFFNFALINMFVLAYDYAARKFED
jgi:lycopene cyclase domain-containing protein